MTCLPYDDADVQKALEIVKMGSFVKENLIKQTQKEVSTYLLSVLRAVTIEQQQLGLIDKEEKDYILDAVFDAALRRGWLD